MSPLSALPALAVTALAMGLAHLYGRWRRLPQHTNVGRNASIDGLRGFLALFVFLHHAVIWYGYLKSGKWQLPPSFFYIHLGQSSVALFFMITAFLFSSKLLDARDKKTQDNQPMLASPVFWQRLYVSRVMRLTPLYFFVLAVMLIIVAIVSDFQLREPLTELLKNIGAWASFIILGRPNLNGVIATSQIIAGVNWTLPYEWFFYFTLPLLALLITIRVSWPYLLFSFAAVAGLWFKIYPWEPNAIYGYAFLGGLVAALTVRFSWLSRLLANSWGKTLGALVALLCLNYVFRHYSSANSLPALAWLTVVFTIVANGNSLFGLLHCRAAQILGEVSYSIYLLHGLVMYCAFKLILGLETAAQLSALSYWGVIFICTVVLLAISFATYRWIEEPAIRSAPKLSRWLESK